MNNRKIQVWLPLLFSITMIIGMFFGYKMRDNMPGRNFFYTEKRKPVQEIMDLIQGRYVDDVNMNALADTAIEAILARLDPHSSYIPAEDLQEENEELAGKFFGIGVEYNIFDDTLNITNVLKDGPGFKGGLIAGDKLISVDDSVLAGKKTVTDTYRKLLRGDRGTRVVLDILRDNQRKKVTLTRDVIPVNSVDASYIIAPATGYIRLNKFTSQTYREFMVALTDLKKKGAVKLILDLRGNGGGILEEAIEIADEFLSADKLISYTEGKHSKRKEYRCRRLGQFEEGKLVVLADEGSASASEILMGALQDWDRATIVGRRSFGKGLVQEQYDLSDHSALRLTIARYYTPMGRSIQKPYDKGGKDYYNEISKRFSHGETQSADSIKNDTSKVYKTSAGKLVYGGGGITPDVFVPIDTSGFSAASSKLYTRGTIGVFAYRFFLQNRKVFDSYKQPSDFISNFSFTEEHWQSFVAAAARDSISLAKISPKEKAGLTKDIRSSIARIIWRYEGLYEVLNTTDPATNRSLEILK